MASSESGNFVAENQPIDLSVTAESASQLTEEISEIANVTTAAQVDPQSICYAITSPHGEILQQSGKRDGSWIIKSRFDVTLRPHKLTFIETGLMVYLADCTYMHIGDPTDAFETQQFKVLGGNLEYADCGHLMVAVRSMVEDREVPVRKDDVIGRLVFTQLGNPNPIRVDADTLADYLEDLITARRVACFIPTPRYGPYYATPCIVLDAENNSVSESQLEALPNMNDTVSSTVTTSEETGSTSNLTTLSDLTTTTKEPSISLASEGYDSKGKIAKDKFNAIVTTALTSMLNANIAPLKSEMETLKSVVKNAIKILMPTPECEGSDEDDEDDEDDSDTASTQNTTYNRHISMEKVKNWRKRSDDSSGYPVSSNDSQTNYGVTPAKRKPTI